MSRARPGDLGNLTANHLHMLAKLNIMEAASPFVIIMRFIRPGIIRSGNSIAGPCGFPLPDKVRFINGHIMSVSGDAEWTHN